ncbi:putative oxidoreductase [Salirhabdus euzebyi]|uniref:Putative oxidoreductase n=1 Tax=Salirhabdus euzebyi TaxID=394506 RepID=A0A841PSL8_9BACI|nr:iron-containing alcohol dehydrogenase family protein [Salirhabdus euzebyi]MBB6451947.1 putative oxidoreductase [Salirhabdus euzebyi]
MLNIQVQGAPNFYQCYEGVLNILQEKIDEQNWQKGILLHGNKSWQAANDFFPNLSTPLTLLPYQGECSTEEVNRISEITVAEHADFIIGVGGGKVMDLAKAVGNENDLSVILIPTLAANCAPWTPLSVFYDGEGNFLHYTIFPKSTYMVLIEPRILLDAPVDYLRAGIGDTLAKWYEADVLSKDISPKPLPLEIALHAAKMCKEVLLKEGEEAISAVYKGHLTSSFVRVIETIILAGGMVGGYGDHYGRIAGAHSIHNGLTYIKETHSYLHGEKVAYGILVQLALENRLDEVEKLLPFYQKLNLPISIKDFGIFNQMKEKIAIIAEEATKPSESIHYMHVSNQKEVINGIYSLEQFISSTLEEKNKEGTV